MNSSHFGNGTTRPADTVPAVQAPSTCPGCRSNSISTTSRKPDENSYWRCSNCGEVWNVSRRNGGRAGSRW